MAGKYTYSRSGSSEIIEKDTLIDDMTDMGAYIAVRVKGFNYGSFAVFNRKKILSKARTRKIVFRKKPCHCQRFGWDWTEWMAGVPIYCKSIDGGGACPLIQNKYTSGSKFKCNYEKAKLVDYIKISEINGIPIERYEVLL